MTWNVKQLFSRKPKPSPDPGPTQPDGETWFQRGSAHIPQQQWQQALECYQEAVRVDPGHAAAHAYMGNVLRQLGKANEALVAYDRAIVIKPDYAEVHYNRASLLQQAGQPGPALASYEAAVASNSAFVEAHCSRGDLLQQLGRPDEAHASYNTAISVNSGFAKAYLHRGALRQQLGQHGGAAADYRQAIALRPDYAGDPNIHFNRGSCLSDLKEWAGAIESYQGAIALRPDYADAHCNLGHAQQEAGLADAAMESYGRALQLNPGLSIALNNRGNLFRSRHQFDQAAQDFRQALTLDPNSVQAHYNLGIVALTRGDFATGWGEYEWRRLIEEAKAASARKFPQPEWRGDTSLEGKRILLHAEQGLGDTIQFCRYTAVVAGLGAHVILEVPPSLVGLLENVAGVSELVVAGGPMPPTDYQCSLMSLPGALKTTLETIPCQVPYLRADPGKVARWHETLGPRTRPRVGLTWSGNPKHRDDRHRSIKLAQWMDLLPDECQYFCLQTEVREDDQRIMESNRKITSVAESFTETAALIETLDLVISVDTSLAHLSAALGRTTWILLPFSPDWRWMLERRDTPWYPTATLYRQPAPGDWRSVLTEVQQDLRAQS
jgi:tetratricopeptide (TPR) repeat protein